MREAPVGALSFSLVDGTLVDGGFVTVLVLVFAIRGGRILPEPDT